MFNTEVLKNIYNEQEYEKFSSIKSEVLQTCSDKKIIKKAEDIVEILVGLKLDIDSACAGFVYPFVIANEELKNKFEKYGEISKILNGLSQVAFYSREYSDPNGLKEMLIAIAKDIRIIIVKIAQILVEARANVKNTNDSFANELYKLIDDIYAPIAARLGLSEIKSELQDLSFEFHKPDEFAKLKFDISHETRANMHMIKKMVSTIKDLLAKNGIECTCYGRIKHISSIYNKLKDKSLTLKNIYDIAATRILVKNISECYAALGIVHANFNPVDGRFKDYIANPKQNGYKSLHTTVYFKGEFFEVQIRTYEMHEFAEYGVAAHFLYKEHKNNLGGLDNKLLWIRKILENKNDTSSEKILEELSTDVYLGEIFVQTPKGKVVKLLENSTPIDFAYLIHSDIGNTCVGARVNGVMVPLTSSLSNGDVVEIITSQNSKGPSKDWLKKVKMQSTKEKINYFFKKQMKEENIKLGRSMIEQCAKSNEVVLQTILKDEYIKIILKKSAFTSFDELCAAVGYGSITAEKIVKRLISLKEQDEQKSKTILDDIAKRPVNVESHSNIIGVQGALTKYCKCCNPIPGDEIIGYVSRGRGVIIHRVDCENVAKLSQSRFIKVDWNTQNTESLSFESVIEVVAKSTSNIYVEITNVFNEQNIKVTSLNTSTNKNGELILKIGALVKDKNQLQKIKNKLVSLASVFEVK